MTTRRSASAPSRAAATGTDGRDLGLARRHGWWVFVLVATTGIVPAIILLAEPAALDTLVAWFGHELPGDVTDTDGGRALARWIGTVLLGSNGLTLAIATGPFRRAEPWAWRALWYWPAMFAVHGAVYAGSARTPQAAWALITAAVLLATRPRHGHDPGP